MLCGTALVRLELVEADVTSAFTARMAEDYSGARILADDAALGLGLRYKIQSRLGRIRRGRQLGSLRTPSLEK